MFSRFAVIVFLSSLLIGCGSTNQRGEIQTSAAPQLSSKEGATLVFNRDDSLLYLALGARIFIDGQQVAKLSRGGAFTTVVGEGKRGLVVDTWSIPGKFSIDLNAEKGKKYQFRISPRSDSVIAGVAFGLIGNVVEDGGAFQLQMME